MKLLVTLSVGLVWACNVPVLTPSETGASSGSIVVAATDQSQSSNIGIMTGDGQVLSSSVLSTGSSNSSSASAVGGDIAFPSTPNPGNIVVILDRYPSSVVTWLDVATAKVRTQLSVATGFAANLHDYVPVSDAKAYVTRFDSNPSPGAQPFDAGGDLLVIDPSGPKIVQRIDVGASLPTEGSYFAHPDRARMVGNVLLVVVPFYDSRHYSGAAYLIAVKTLDDRVADYLRLEGVSGCSGLDVSPDHATLAIACSGGWHGQSLSDPQSSAIVGVSLAPRLSEAWRVAAPVADGRPFAFAVSFVDTKHVVASRLGALGPPSMNDSIELIDTEARSITTILESEQPVTLGVGPCQEGTGQCFATDAGRNQVVRFDFDPNGGYSNRTFDWNDPVGLPPRAVALINAGAAN